MCTITTTITLGMLDASQVEKQLKQTLGAAAAAGSAQSGALRGGLLDMARTLVGGQADALTASAQLQLAQQRGMAGVKYVYDRKFS